MPTPEAALASRGGPQDPAKRREGGHSVSLADAVHVLPAPTAADAASSGGSVPANVTLTDAATDRRGLQAEAVEPIDTMYGEYAPAVARWERILGRRAPAPTEPGTGESRRLSPAFVEWMMGLPAGHVTESGLSRQQQLKALGNGVVPLQAAAATLRLLERKN